MNGIALICGIFDIIKRSSVCRLTRPENIVGITVKVIVIEKQGEMVGIVVFQG